jgi:uncharacterized protein (TIGR02145 family)
LSTNVLANNVRFNSKPSVFLSGDTVMISFSLSWDHSWRDDFNWDAIWVFGKWSKGMEDSWHHLKLLPSGHSAPSGFTYDAGNIDASNAGGVFLMRADQGSGNVNNQTFTIKTMRADIGNITEENINENDVSLSLAAIEMVYIPYGGYYLGDDSTANRLGSNNGGMVAVNSEDALNVYPVTAGSEGAAKSLPATYPKGYKGFYCMKYEVSQEQYVSFLNNLTRAQQKARIGNDLDKLKVGEYVFGDKSRPSYRNGICVLANSSDAPAVFGCNLNPAEPYFGEDDGQCIACNYLTSSDMLAYCDWACLRPMSELEYEKACRKPYPQAALAGEFVWNSASGINGLSGAGALLNAGRINEKPSSTATNVNYNNADLGPVRSASFGTSSSTQAQAGATFWGLMEMSGNVAELCYSVNATTFNTSDIYTSHGNGAVNANGTSDIATSIWANTAASFIAKGGSFASTNTDELMISDRTRANVSDIRDSTMGFRAVHTFGSSSAVVNPGIIKVASISCPDAAITVSDSVQASATWNGVAMNTKVSYVWYVQKGSSTVWELIPNETSESVTYVQGSFSGASLSLKFKRKAITALGEATTATVTTTIPNLTISFDPVSAILSACGGTEVKAKITYTSTTPTFTWITETETKTGASNKISYKDFVDSTSTEGNQVVACIVDVAGCNSSANLTVAVSPIEPNSNFSIDGNFIDSRDNKAYPVRLFGTQCWMTKNMNVGTRVSGSDYSTHGTAGIQKICYNNDENNCTTYGGLYNWAEAVNGENVGAGMAIQSSSKNIKYAVDGSGHTQGICPDGWHIPSDVEFKTLEMYLGMTQAQANGTDWRGTNQGTLLKSTTGWNGLLGGYRNDGGGSFNNFGSTTWWWLSSETSGEYAWIRVLPSSDRATVLRTTYNKQYGFFVRCLLN